jgi:Holliday junction resolvase RusA-like endonuclease
MIGNPMPLSNRNVFVIKERFPTYLSPRMREVYRMKIIREFVKQCGDLFFNEKVPVALTIEIVEKKRLKKEEREEPFAVGHPRLDTVTKTFIEALNGAAYYSASQVSEVYVSKLNGNDFQIRVQLTRS